IHLPDDGIEKFASLGVKGNPKIRVFIQENWLPYDMYDTTFSKHPKVVDHDAPAAADLKKLHEKYFKDIDDHVQALNKKLASETASTAASGCASAGWPRSACRCRRCSPPRRAPRGRSARRRTCCSSGSRAGRRSTRRSTPSPTPRPRCAASSGPSRPTCPAS